MRLMYERGVEPNLIAVEEPWIVVGAAKTNNPSSAPAHSAEDMITMLVEKKNQREADAKAAEK